ncbi:uncharacterized protein LOC143445767 [Clavelina lepadiformis]|uniref:uncharacterized protein LOC143445767 n=1 Tax=Clavelina lepadiformis TaxID=159417 RepID=UPI0040418F4D
MTEREPASIKYFVAKEILCNLTNNVLGRGGFGTVRLGHHQILGRLAVKCTNLEGSPDDLKRNKDQILREIKMMILARHKHVVDVHGVIDEEKFIGLVMEHMPAGSFYDFIFNKKLPSLPMPLLLRMNYESSDGITYLHKLLKDRRIAHGDLKPQNILLTADLHCKVADFGGAAFSQNTISYGTPTAPDKPGEGKEYTWVFTAPERLNGDCNRLTTSMDVYSFGVILFMSVARKYPELPRIVMKVLNSENPFEDDFDLFKKGLEENSEDLKITTLFESIMVKSVDKDPSKRPPMIRIRDQLQDQLKQIKLTTLAQHVANVLPHVEIREVLLNKNDCRPINELYSKTKPRLSTASRGENENVNADNFSSKNVNVVRKEEDGIDSGYSTILVKMQTVKGKLVENGTDDANSQADKLFALIKSNSLSHDQALRVAYDIIKLTKGFPKEKFSCTIIKLLESVSLIFKWIEKPCDKLKLIIECILRANVCVANFVMNLKMKEKICEKVISYLIDVREVIDMSGCDDDRLVVKTKAFRWLCLGLCYRQLKNNDQALNVNIKAVSALESVFGSDCNKLSVYASCCNNLAADYQIKGKPGKQLEYFLKSHYAKRETTDYEDEEKWRRDQFITLSNVCYMYENYTELSKRKAPEILDYLLQASQHLTGWALFQNEMMALRFALIMKRKPLQIEFCKKVVHKSSTLSAPSDRYFDLCYQAKCIVKSLLSEKLHELASSLLQCAIQWCKHIPEVDLLHKTYDDLSRIVCESSCPPKQLALISTGFVDEIVNDITRFQCHDKLDNLKALGRVLERFTRPNRRTRNYRQDLVSAVDLMRRYARETLGHSPQQRNRKGEVQYQIALCQNNLGNVKLAKEALLQAVEILQSVPVTHRNEDIINKCLQKIIELNENNPEEEEEKKCRIS